MRCVTEEEAKELICIRRSGDGFNNCIASKCFSWVEIDRRIEREDHSGAREIIMKEGIERNPPQKYQRKGPGGSTGILFLEARGTCAEIYKI